MQYIFRAKKSYFLFKIVKRGPAIWPMSTYLIEVLPSLQKELSMVNTHLKCYKYFLRYLLRSKQSIPVQGLCVSGTNTNTSSLAAQLTELNSLLQLQLATASSYSHDMLPPFSCEYEFDRWPNVKYCTFNFSIFIAL